MEKTETSVLKGGEFLVRETDPQSIYIPAEIDEEQKMIVDMCREFLEKEVMPNLDRIDKQEEGLMQSLLDKAGELGMLSTAIPEAYGGFGKDFNTNTFLAEIIGAGNSFPVSLMAHTGIGTLPILYFGTEDQKQKYLPKLSTGELKACYCLTEPGSGSDALAAKTKAVLSDDKSHYVINGQKMWITNGGFADVFIVFAQVDEKNQSQGESGFTGFILERNMEGLTTGEEEHKMGIKGSSTCQVFFEDCKVPAENLLGEIGKGHLIAFNILNIGRFKLAAATLGGAKKVCTQSVAYANQRSQFGKSIASFGAIQHKLAEQAIRIFACEAALFRTSQYIDQREKELAAEGASAGDALLGAAKEYAVECALLKVFGSEMLDYVVDEGVQIHGGYGFSEEYPVARSYRDSRINRIFEGTNEINRMLIMDMLIKRTMKGQLNLLGPAKAIQQELMSIPDFGAEQDSLFVKERKAVQNLKKAALMTAGAAVQKLMMKLTDEQEILMDIADMVMETYICESFLLRVEKLESQIGEEGARLHVDMLRTYLSDAIERVNVSGKHALAAFAEGDELRMLLLGLKRFTKFDPVNTKNARRNIAAKLIADNKYAF